MKNKKIKKLLNEAENKRLEFHSLGASLVVQANPFIPSEIELHFEDVNWDGLCFGFDYNNFSYLFPIDKFFDKVEELNRELNIDELLGLCI